MPTDQVVSSGHKVRPSRIARPTAAIYALLFVSAGPAAIYQLSWHRVLSDALGNEVAAGVLLVASLMLGLALGNLAGGALSRRQGLAPFRLIAAFAMASGALGLAALPIFAVLGVLASGSGLTATTIAAALTLVAASGFPIGASLPLTAEVLRGSRRVGPPVGRVASLTFAGAGLACLAGLFFGFRSLALPDAICIAAVISAAVTCAALLIHRDANTPRDGIMKSLAVSARHKTALRLVPLLSIAAAVGFVAWAYEAFFFRAVLYVTQSSMTALFVTLGAYLAGLGYGAEQAGRGCMILTRDGAMRRALGALMKANLAGMLFLPLMDHTAWLDRGVLGIAVLLVFIMGRFWGALLPYLAELGIAADGAASGRVAWLAFAHHAGAALGVSATGFALMAGLGLSATAAMLVAAGLVCAVMLVFALAVPRWEKMLRASLVGALGLSAMAIIPFGSAKVLDRLRVIGAVDSSPIAAEVEIH